MAVYPVALESFEHMERHYSSIKPIRGSKKVPIGCRGRPYEHIVKKDKFNYAVYSGNREAINWSVASPHSLVTVRYYGSYADQLFLYRFLPMGMKFFGRAGKWFLSAESTGGKWVDHVIPYVYDQRYAGLSRGNSMHELVFKGSQKEGWTLLSPEYPTVRLRVNKKAKAPYVKAFKKFWEDFTVLAPLLNIRKETHWGDREGYNKAKSAVGNYLGDEYYKREMFGYGKCPNKGNGDLTRKLLLDNDAEQRADLMVMFICDAWDNAPFDYNTRTTKDIFADPKALRGKLTQWLNKECNFIEECLI